VDRDDVRIDIFLWWICRFTDWLHAVL